MLLICLRTEDVFDYLGLQARTGQEGSEQRAGEQTDPSELFPFLLKMRSDAGKEVSPPLPATSLWLGLSIQMEKKSLYQPNCNLHIPP